MLSVMGIRPVSGIEVGIDPLSITSILAIIVARLSSCSHVEGIAGKSFAMQFVKVRRDICHLTEMLGLNLALTAIGGSDDLAADKQDNSTLECIADLTTIPGDITCLPLIAPDFCRVTKELFLVDFHMWF